MQERSNQAKEFLRRYRAILYRQESLIRTLDALRARQVNTTINMDAVQISGVGYVSDKMAEAVAKVLALEDQIIEAEAKARAQLADIMEAINSVKDDTLKTILLLRYVEGLGWVEIAERMHYEKSSVFIFHGRALMAVQNWIDKHWSKLEY